MIRIAIDYMYQRSEAATDVDILALWHSDKFSFQSWINLNQMMLHVNVNRTRLIEKLKSLENQEFIESLGDWENMEKEERKKYMDLDPNTDWKQKYNYKITEYGVKTFKKIREQCLDEDTQKILRMPVNT